MLEVLGKMFFEQQDIPTVSTRHRQTNHESPGERAASHQRDLGEARSEPSDEVHSMSPVMLRSQHPVAPGGPHREGHPSPKEISCQNIKPESCQKETIRNISMERHSTRQLA